MQQHRKVFYSLVFEDHEWDFESDKELRGTLKVRPFNSSAVPESQMCLWLGGIGIDQCHYQLWWWELSPPAELPKLGWEFDVSDTLRVRIQRVWEGQDLYAILRLVTISKPQLKTMFEVVGIHQR